MIEIWLSYRLIARFADDAPAKRVSSTFVPHTS